LAETEEETNVSFPEQADWVFFAIFGAVAASVSVLDIVAQVTHLALKAPRAGDDQLFIRVGPFRMLGISVAFWAWFLACALSPLGATSLVVMVLGILCAALGMLYLVGAFVSLLTGWDPAKVQAKN
jgi:hypothetical protein